MSGTKGHSGRRRKATARFRGETWVRLSMVTFVKSENGTSWNDTLGGYYVDGKKYTDFASAAAEFVRRVA